MSKVVGATSGQGGIPFAIEGTTSSPKFVPEIGGAVVAGLATGAAPAAVSNVTQGQIPGTKSLTKDLGGVLGKESRKLKQHDPVS